MEFPIITPLPISLRAGAVARDAIHTDVSLDTIANNLSWISSWAGKVNVRELNTGANSIRRASQVDDDLSILAGGGTVNVVKDDVGEVDCRRVGGALGGVDVEVALIQNDRSIGVLDMDVAVGYIVDATVSDILAGPCLETGSVLGRLAWPVTGVLQLFRLLSHLSIQQCDVLNMRILDVIHLTRVLPNASHADTMGVVAPQVLHENIGCVGLWRKAVIADVDSGICHAESVHVQRIETVGVFGQRLPQSVGWIFGTRKQ